MAIPTRMAMIAITIINSISVKPSCLRVRFRRRVSPLGIGGAISRLLGALAIHIENILASPGLRLRVVLVAALAPVERIGHGVLGDAPQELDLLIHLTSQLYAFHKLLQALGPAIGSELLRPQQILIGGVLVFIHRGADLPQSVVQLALAIPPHLVACQWNRHRRQQRQDRERHNQLDEGQPFLPSSPHISFYCTVTATVGVASVMGCCLESFNPASLTVTLVSPLPIAMNVNCASTPDPFTPPAPATRLRLKEASPASLRISRTGGFVLPSDASRPPGVIPLSCKTFGSHLTRMGAAKTSAALSSWSTNMTGPLNGAVAVGGDHESLGGAPAGTGAGGAAGVGAGAGATGAGAAAAGVSLGA